MKKDENKTLYAIHYIDVAGELHFEGVTNNFDAWLKDYNEGRQQQGISIDDAEDFDVQKVEVSYF
tara:strand:+ start:452 stop:646 length:195 start_codon:yes stop_codon:yes gene_type:complete